MPEAHLIWPIGRVRLPISPGHGSGSVPVLDRRICTTRCLPLTRLSATTSSLRLSVMVLRDSARADPAEGAVLEGDALEGVATAGALVAGALGAGGAEGDGAEASYAGNTPHPPTASVRIAARSRFRLRMPEIVPFPKYHYSALDFCR